MKIRKPQYVPRLSVLAALLVSANSLSAAEANEKLPAGGLEEVTVTAQFRAQNMQDTGLAITAFTAETLESQGAASVTDISAFVPNAVIAPLGAGWGATAAAFIRGVGLGDNILSYEPGVPIYVDDVYNGRPQGAIFDLLDLERVEVLRGPQGTLFGKNAIGGTVRLISKKPQGDNTGFVEASIGRFNRLNFRGAVDLPVVENSLFARMSYSSKTADGYFKVKDYECVNGAGSLGMGTTGALGLAGQSLGGGGPGSCVIEKLGDENVQSGRVALRWLASETAEVNLVADYTRQRQAGPADKYTIIDGSNFLVGLWNDAVAEPLFGTRYDDRFITDDFYSNYSRFDDPITNRKVPNVNNLDHWGVSATVDIDLTDDIHLKSITAHREFENSFGRDSDGSPLPMNATYDVSIHDQFSQEFQITGTKDAFDYAFGTFYYNADDSNRGFDFLLPGIIYQQDAYDTQETTSWAVFAHGVYNVTDRLSVTAGIRYTKDKKDAVISRTAFDGTVRVNNVPVNLEASNTSPMLEVNYRWNDSFMTYALWSTGFRGGGFSPRPSNDLQVDDFGPEEITNFEVGFKSDLFDDRLRLNASTFVAKYEHQQTFRADEAPVGVPWFHGVNAGKSRRWGVEVELQANPFGSMYINGSLGYLGYKLLDDEGSNLCAEFDNGDKCYPTRAPELNTAVSVEYEFDAGRLGTFTPHIDWTYQSEVWFTTFTNLSAPGASDVIRPPKPDFGNQDGYSLINAQVSWKAQDDDWGVTLYGKNLTNKEYFYGKLSLVGFFGREQGNVAPPREWGIKVRKDF